MKSISPAIAAASVAGHVRAVLFVEFQFASGTQRYCTASYTMSWLGQEWVGLGSLADVEEIRETDQLVATGVRFTLSGIPSAIVAMALGEDIQGRRCRAWYAFLDENYQVIDMPPLEFEGRVDVPAIIDGGSSGQIVITVESRLADFARPNVRRYNDADQQAQHPGDRFFEFMPQMVEMEIVWPARSFFL